MSSISAAVRADDSTLRGAVIADLARTIAAGAGRARATALDYSIVTTRADFENLAADWDALFARAGRGAQAFQTFSWCWHWCNHYLDEASRKVSLAIVTGRSEGRLVLVWPLVRVRTGGVVKLESLGAPASQYSDALVEASPEAERQLRFAWASVVAAAKPDLAWLPRVREDAAIAPLMGELGALAAQRMEAPYIDLSATPDFDTYMARRSAQARKKRRAAERRQSQSDVQFINLADSEPASALAADTIDMKRRQLRERGIISSAFVDRKLRAFFAGAALGGRHLTGTRVIAMQHDGACAAANILVSCHDHMIGHVFTYDSRYAKDSAGWSLLHETIKQAIASGCQTFDLLSPADEYKRRLADGTVNVVNWVVPLSTKGTAFAQVYLMLAVPLLKRGMKLMPARWRSLLAQRYYGKG